MCSGVGYINRGFERVARDLFDSIHGRTDVILIGGGGSARRDEVVLRVPRRNGLLSALGRERAYRAELAAFALRLIPVLVRRRVELVNYFEPYLGNLLAVARSRMRLHYKLLLTDGLGLTAKSVRYADTVHVLTPLAREALLRDGWPEDRVVFVPQGIHAARFASVDRRSPDARLALDVAALNRRHKRIDVLIDEVARLEDSTELLVLGDPEEPDLIELGRARLGDRFRHEHVRAEDTPGFYSRADVFVHAALEEGFGLAAVEAMASGLPVVMHDSPHFRWLVGDPDQLVDFTQPGALKRGLERMPAAAGARNRQRAAEFDWMNLAPRYVEMYGG